MLTIRNYIELAKCKAKPPPTKEELEANPYTEMPNDFVPLNTKMTPTMKEPAAEEGHQHKTRNGKRQQGNHGTHGATSRRWLQ